MGTRFLLTADSKVPDEVKKAYLGTPVTGTVVSTAIDGAPQRVIRTEVVDSLLGIKGVGPWTAQYVVMRGLGDPDVFLGTDLGVRRALDALGLDETASYQRCRLPDSAGSSIFDHAAKSRPESSPDKYPEHLIPCVQDLYSKE